MGRRGEPEAPDMMSMYLSGPDSAYAESARAMRPTARENPDGTHSTVKMMSIGMDGKHYAVPTLFPDGQGGWQEYEGIEAYEEAERRGEVFEFGSDEEAQRFAGGSWKKPRGN